MRLEDADKETLARWYADLNSWKWPDDLEVFGPQPELDEDGEWKRGDAVADRAWKFVRSALTEAELSRGWWIYALKRTEDDWREWWGSRDQPTL